MPKPLLIEMCHADARRGHCAQCSIAGCRFRADLLSVANGRLFLGSGIGPTGEGDNTIVAFAPNNDMPSRLVSDPELSPLDLAIARVGAYDPNLAPQRTGGASDDGVGVSGAGLRAGGAAGRGGGAEILAMSPAICC